MFLLTSVGVSAQDIIFNAKSYKGGYNVSCKSSTDGVIDATIVGGIPPYTYSWGNGAVTQDLSNVGAGIYTLTATDAVGSTKTKSITLFEADLLEVFFTAALYDGGYHISKMGANDGAITTDVKGGAPPYKYLWSNGSQKANQEQLTAGSYSVVITDQNGCTTTKTIILLEPTPISLTLTASTFGAYNTKCFESKDGNINLTVSGGMPPYKFNWSNGSFDEDPINLGAGKYDVQVFDANKASMTASIILTQPAKLQADLSVSMFSNGYNISCNECSNGTITTTITGGTMPGTYYWKGRGVDGLTTANLINLGPGDYNVLVTDGNNCKTESRTYLTEPPANGWNKNGNSIDTTNFLGSTNNAPLVLKTNNTEKFRIAENGNIGIGTNNPQVKMDVNGSANISGDLFARQGIKFDDTNGISYTNVAGTKTYSYGKGGILRTTCAAPGTASAHVFNGILQVYSDGGSSSGAIELGSGLLNLQTWTGALGTPGGSSIDASIEGNTTPGRLLLNYFCGNSTFINTGVNGGDVIMTSSGNVGIGTSTPAEKLDIAGNIRMNSNAIFLKNDVSHGLKYVTSFGSTAGLDGPALFGHGSGILGTMNGGEKTALYWNENGDIKITSLSGGADKIVTADADGKLSSTPLTAAGLGLWQTTNGTDIFHLIGNVGIGTSIPTSNIDKLCVAAVGYSSNANGGISIQSLDGYSLPMWQARLALKSDGSGNPRTAIDFITRYSPGTDVEVMSFLPNGNVGIGTINPIAPLEVAGTATFRGQNITLGNPTGSPQENVNLTYVSTDPAYSRALLMGKLNVGLSLGTNNQEQLSIDLLGNVGIGTGIDHIPAGYKLSVNGNMRAKDIIVTLTGWPDYVFEENYSRMSILDKETFYKKEKHLPNITCANEIETEGLKIGKNMTGIVQNIEENTLDIADLYKRMLLLEKENAELKATITTLNEKN